MQPPMFLLIGRIQPPTGDILQRYRHTRTVHHTKKRTSLFICVPFPIDYADYVDYTDYADYGLVLSPLLTRLFVRIANRWQL